MMQLAMYKGPARKPVHKLTHAVTKAWFKSPHSHSELVIDGVCWTSSGRDGGVRDKVIDLTDGKWDVYPVHPRHEQAYAEALFAAEKGKDYDYAGVVGYAIRFIKHALRRWFCFEIVAAALRYPGRRDRISPQELIQHATT